MAIELYSKLKLNTPKYNTVTYFAPNLVYLVWHVQVLKRGSETPKRALGAKGLPALHRRQKEGIAFL